MGFGADAFEQLVEGEDLGPVGVLRARRLGVHGGDRRLQLVGPDRARASASVTSAAPSAIASPRPQRAVLLGQRDQRAVGAGPGRAARVGEQHQREQPRDLAVVGEQGEHGPREADRLAREVGALEVGPGGGGVALVEDQVEHVQHDPQAVGELALGRQARRSRRRP